jgi:hypothetical protein
MEMVRTLGTVLAILFVSMSGSAAAQTLAQASDLARKGPPIDPALRADIVRLMDMTGASAASTQMARQFSDAFFNGFKQTQQSVPPRVIEIVRQVLNTEFEQAFNGSELKDQQIALYARYFSHDDVKGLLAFYESEIGKKAIAALPNLSRDGADIGERWAKMNMPRVMKVLETRLKSEGLMPETASLR